MVIFSVGTEGSGRATYGKELKTKFPSIRVINPGEMMQTSPLSYQDIKHIVDLQLNESMMKNETIYYIDKMLSKKSRKYLFELCKKYNQKMIGVVFLTSFRPDICEHRMYSKTGKSIYREVNGESYMNSQWRDFLTLTRDIKQLENDMAAHSSDWRIKYIECQPE